MPGGYVGGRAKDSSKLSTDPKQIRNRLRRKGKKFHEDLQLYAEHGFKPLEQWDLEELARGRPRNRNGSFAGPSPKWITHTLQVEIKRRLLTETLGQLGGHLDVALKAVRELITSTEVDEKGKPIVDPRTKLAAATFVIEHIIGKPTAVIELNQAQDFTRAAIASAIVLDDGEPQGHLGTIDGDFTVDEEDDEMEEIDDDDDE
jgi:hypothetical protein